MFLPSFLGVKMSFVCKYARSKLLIIPNPVHLSSIVLKCIWEQKVEMRKEKNLLWSCGSPSVCSQASQEKTGMVQCLAGEHLLNVFGNSG